MVDAEDCAGVYVITFATGEVYVGSSVDVPVRWQVHQRELRAGCHCNHRLQAAWAASGGAASFSMVARLPGVPVSALVRHEAWVLSQLASEGRPVLNVLAPCRLAEKITPCLRRPLARRQGSHSLTRRFRQERELLILQAAAELAVEKGWRGYTVGEVAARVGIPSTTVYLHFARKEYLVAAVRERSIAPAGDVSTDKPATQDKKE